MANHYTQFSEMVEKLTDAEIAWMKADIEKAENDEEYDDGYYFQYSFEVRDNQTNLWLHAEEGGDPEHVAKFMQKFLTLFRPQDLFTLTWSSTCSKPQLGEFGGGGVVVTAKSVNFMDTWSWARKKAAELAGASQEEPAEEDSAISLDTAKAELRRIFDYLYLDWTKEDQGVYNAGKVWDIEIFDMIGEVVRPFFEHLFTEKKGGD